jgi:catecholate siderophore receptor
VLQLGAGYQSAKMDIYLTLKNVLNRQYFVAAHSGANDYNMPGEPRTLTASVRYRF